MHNLAVHTGITSPADAAATVGWFEVSLAPFLNVKDLSDLNAIRRRRLQVLAALFFASLTVLLVPVAVIVFGPLSFVSAITVMAAMGWLSIPYILRFTHNEILAGILAATIFYGVTSIGMAATEGIHSISKWLLILAPWAATFAISARAGIISAVLAVVQLCSLYWLTASKLYTPPMSPLAQDSLVTQLLFPSLVISSAAIFAWLLDRDRSIIASTLNKSYNDFRAVIGQFPDGIVIVRDDLVAFTNSTFAQTLGYESPDDLVGRRFQSLLHEQGKHFEMSSATSLTEARFLTTDGKTVHMEISLVGSMHLLAGNSKVIAARDITARGKAQAKHALTERLLSVGTLAAGVAHEVNNPLAYVIANIEFIKEEMFRTHGANWRSTMEDVGAALFEAEDGAHRVRRIVRDLKVFSQRDSQERGVVNIKDVLDTAAKMCFNEVRHRAQLVRSFGNIPTIHASESRLAQVFLNLIMNAAQSIPEGHAADNEIRLSTWSHEDGRVVAEVVDTGCGIAAEDLPHVFDPFFTKKPVGIGTGLGLSISHSIIEGMGGSIEVESEVGRGTTFRVVLPAPQIKSDPVPRKAATSAAAKDTVKVLIVDDEPNIARAIKRSLKKHQVTIATSGREAIELCKKYEFDAILCDVMMPEITGPEVYDWLRTNSPGYEKRIVFLSGGAFTAASTDFLAHIPNRLIDKPYNIKDVEEALIKAAKGQ